jgi:hypothetical protein
MSGTDFIAPELNVNNINTDVSGEFVHGNVQTTLDDASNNLTLYVSKSKMNQIFLFYSDNTTGNDSASDLSDFSNTDLKYALNLQQWNPKLQTTKQERKNVTTNYLIDLFGGGASQALANVDVFSNEEDLDADISDIFQNRASQTQRNQISIAKHGYFNHSGSLTTVNHQRIIDASSSDYGALTRQLLESAALAARDNSNNTIFRRQFDTTNTSNADYNLPTGWRTFQFIEGDTFSYNLSIKQLNSFFPSWSLNQSALTGGSLPTSYRVKFIINDDPSGQTADFITPNISINQIDNVNNSNTFYNIITNNVAGSQVNEITTTTSLSNDANVLIDTNVTIPNVDYNSLGESEKTTIIQELKELYAEQLNINPSSILITLSSGSLKINIKIYDTLLTGITLIGGSSVQIFQNTSYVDLSATALNNGIDVTNYLVIDSSGVNTSIPGNYSVYFSVTGTSLSAIRTVVVIDNISPTLQLTGNASVSVNQGESYTEQGARIIDSGVDIGAILNDANGSNSGHVRVYQYNGSQWVQIGQDIDGEANEDQSGHSVSINSDGTIVAIGAKLNDANGANSGHVRVYQYNGSLWVQIGLDIDGEASVDQSGHSVSINSDGTIVAIGAKYNDGNGADSGHARVYQYNGSQWVQIGQDIDGEANNDHSGASVSLNSDGTIVAIGATYNDGNGSSNSGHVRVYQYNGSLWVQIGLDIDGEASVDQSGHSVSINSDGTIVAIGAPYNDGNGSNSGHVRVYQLTN